MARTNRENLTQSRNLSSPPKKIAPHNTCYIIGSSSLLHTHVNVFLKIIYYLAQLEEKIKERNKLNIDARSWKTRHRWIFPIDFQYTFVDFTGDRFMIFISFSLSLRWWLCSFPITSNYFLVSCFRCCCQSDDWARKRKTFASRDFQILSNVLFQEDFLEFYSEFPVSRKNSTYVLLSFLLVFIYTPKKVFS